MYDLYTYNTTAWEHKGYEYRQALRKSDIAAVAEGLFLTKYSQMTRPARWTRYTNDEYFMWGPNQA